MISLFVYSLVSFHILYIISHSSASSAKTDSVQAAASTAQDPREFCVTEFFEPRCGDTEVVMITNATYGRMRIGRCVVTDYGYLGCKADVLTHMDHVCSGRRTCKLHIPDKILESANHTCPHEFKAYLNVSYTCVAVEMNSCYTCSTSQFAHLTQPWGYLASSTTAAQAAHLYPCGSARCPWRIEVQSGQKIHLTLYDFAMEERPGGFYSAMPVSEDLGESCYRYAVIKEAPNMRDVPVCGGRGRVQEVYESVTNVIEIHVVSPEVLGMLGHFVFHYRAVGCPDYVAPSNEWVKRNGSKVEVGCKSTDAIWQLTCNKTQWLGAGKSCPETLRDNVTASPPLFSLSVGLLITIVIGIAFVVAVLIVTVGVVCLKRYRSAMAYRPESPYYSQRLEMQYYEPHGDYKSHDRSMSTLQKPNTSISEASKYRQQQLAMHALADHRRNLYGAPRMDQRPLPSIPNQPETYDTPFLQAGTSSAQRTVRADISVPAAFREPAPTSLAAASVTSSRTRMLSAQLPPSQHYTVLDPVETCQLTSDNPPGGGFSQHQDGSSIAHGASQSQGLSAFSSETGLDIGPQSYMSEENGSTVNGRSSGEEMHSSCGEIPLRPMRDGSQPSTDIANNSGNCSWP